MIPERIRFARETLIGYLALPPEMRAPFMRKGNTRFKEWHGKVRTPIELDRDRYSLEEAAEIIGAGPRSTAIVRFNGKGTTPDFISKENLRFLIEERVHKASVSSLHAALKRRGHPISLPALYAKLREDGALVRAESGGSKLHPEKTIGVVDALWRRLKRKKEPIGE